MKYIDWPGIVSERQVGLSIVIAVVINMFRLPDLLTGENIAFNRLKLFQT